MNTTFHPNWIRSPKLHRTLDVLTQFRARILVARRVALRKLFGSPLPGNPLHEAWTADGEPLERLSPAEVAQACTSRYLIMPPNRGQ